MKFKNKKTGVIVVAKNMYEENILKSNSNYIEVKENAPKNEKTVQKKLEDNVKTSKKGGE